MKNIFRTPHRFFSMVLAGSLLFPCIGKAEENLITTPNHSTQIPQQIHEMNPTVPRIPMNVPLIENLKNERRAPVRMQMPVWTEELGEVDLDKYTEEELDKMVDDFWTPERMRNAIPMDMEVSENKFQMDFLDSSNYSSLLKALSTDPLIVIAFPALPNAVVQKATAQWKSILL